jgi:glucokinase
LAHLPGSHEQGDLHRRLPASLAQVGHIETRFSPALRVLTKCGYLRSAVSTSQHFAGANGLAEQLATADDPTPIIVNAALAGECELCIATLNTFVSILGAEAGNLGLKVLATGGVYLGGGIPPRILPALQDGKFMQAFVNKGRFSELLARMPVHVILNPKAALLGAACHGLEQFPYENG